VTERECAIVLGLSPTGLSVARSLTAHDVDVYGVDSLGYEIGHFSRSVKSDSTIRYLPPGRKLLDGLIAFRRSKSGDLPVLFIASDAYIDFVGSHWEELRRHFILTTSMRQAVNSVLLNKRTFYETCGRIGVATPRTFFPETDEQVTQAAAEIRYPAIVKPSLGFQVRKSLRGKKLVEVGGPSELLRWWRTFREWNADVVLQECISGPEQNIAVAALYTDEAGTCRSLFTAKKYRQYPPNYGSASYVESQWMPDVARLSRELVLKLGYRGICGTEFKWDLIDRQWKLIEMNCRPTLWFAITRAAGVDVVWDAYCDLRGRPNATHVGNQIDGVRWQLFVRDAASTLYFLKRRELSWRELWRTAIDQRNKEWAVCAWDDWGANVGYALNTIAQVWVNYVRPRKRGE
jgi:predicted ATP-grasp superfamily ATP-dependent carboligase